MEIFLRVIAVVCGLLAGGAIVAGVEGLSSLVHPLPEGLELNDREALQQWVATLPVSAFLMLLVAWFAGCTVGAGIARWIAPRRSAIPAVIVCVLLTVATIFNLAVLPHPWWMWPGGILACLVGGLVGIGCVAPRQHCGARPVRRSDIANDPNAN
jgi:hypothetical protein